MIVWVLVQNNEACAVLRPQDPSHETRAYRDNAQPLLQQSEYNNAVGGSDVDFAVGNHGRNKFVIRKVIAAVRCLIAVVQFGGKICGVIGSQHTSAIILYDPDDSVGRSVR